MTQLVDDASIRTFGYNTYGERESDSLVVDGDTHLIVETRDSFGRSTGFVYSKNGTVQHTVTTGYGTDGRISSAGFTHGGAVKQFGYEYLNGSNLLHKLTKPNNMTLTQTYEATRDLLTGMAYHRGTTLIAQRTYSYDILGRPTARNTARNGQTVNDTFAHNNRSELVGATVNSKEYEYAYDNIGNRQQATEGNDVTVYDTNALNQYTAISENGSTPFAPQFDADGNQTLIKTDTGIWSAVYNAENRPVTFTNSDSSTVVECQYDSMGRRAYKKVTVNGSVTLHQRYIYRGYLQISCIDLTRSNHPALWFITWDPTQPVATRPLAIRLNGTWYTYGWDLTKNICELYSTEGRISTSYTYSPFGKVTATGSLTQPIQWSSEIWDSELGLMYYNWRYYNTDVGKWNSRDFSEIKDIYSFVNSPSHKIDVLGLQANIPSIGGPSCHAYSGTCGYNGNNIDDVRNATALALSAACGGGLYNSCKIVQELFKALITYCTVEIFTAAFKARKFNSDKEMHCFASCYIKVRCTKFVSELAGETKEIYDKKEAEIKEALGKINEKALKKIIKDSNLDLVANRKCLNMKSESECNKCCRNT